MKKLFVALMMIIMLLPICVGCNSILKNKPVEVHTLEMLYDETASIKSIGINLPDYSVKNKDKVTQKVTTFLCGDNIEIYYKNENKDKIFMILVDQAKVMRVKKRCIPGNGMELIVEGEKAHVFYKTSNVINFDNTYLTLSQIPDGAELFITYREEETEIVEKEYKWIHAKAIYSYYPR